jgi:hypothetical protein
MAAERTPIEVSDNPELLRLVEAVEASGKPCVLQRDGKDVAVLSAVKPGRKRGGPLKPPGATSLDDPLWEIVGMFNSDGPTDVASNKHKYLAEAYADLHEGPDDSKE